MRAWATWHRVVMSPAGCIVGLKPQEMPSDTSLCRILGTIPHPVWPALLARTDYPRLIKYISCFDRGTTLSNDSWDTNPQTSWVAQPFSLWLTQYLCTVACPAALERICMREELYLAHMLKNLQRLFYLSHWRISCINDSHNSHRCHFVRGKCRKLSRVIFRILHVAAITCRPLGNILRY